jgi:outer membrane protein
LFSEVMKNLLLAAVMISIYIPFVQAADLLTSWEAARAHDANFAAAQNALSAGMEKSNQGDAAVLPQVALIGNANQARNDRPAGQGTSTNPGGLTQGQQYGLSVAAVQPIYNAAAFVTRDQFKKQALQAQVQYRLAEQDLILRVAKAYFDVLLAKENVALSGAQIEAIGQQLALAKKSFEIGTATITDTNDAQSRFDAAVASEISAKNDLEVKSNAYRLLTGLDAAQLSRVLETRPPSPPQPASVATWIDKAYDGSLAIAAQDLGLQIAAKDIERYKLETAPTVSLVASYGGNLNSGGLTSTGERQRTTSSVIGLQVSIPLYTGGNRSSQLRAAVALRDQQQDILEAVRRDAEQATRQAFLGVESGAAQIKALEQARISSASSLSSSKRGREVGVRTTIDVLNAQQNYYQTLYNLAAARYQYLLSKLQLAASVGNLNQTELADVNTWLVANGQSGPEQR